MVRLSQLVACAGLGVFVAGSAMAADYRSPPLVQRAPDLVEEFGSGWYLRGDVGWVGHNDANATRIVNGTAGAAYAGEALDDTWLIGGGFGYKQGWFRADLTGDYRSRADFKGTRGAVLESGNLSAFTAMLNGYLDLGTWSGITPYVGAGLGAAYFEIDGWRASNNSVNIVASNNWDFAWSAMAGVAIGLGPGFQMDVGYRYINMGQPTTSYDAMQLQPTYVRFDDLTAHEVRVGIRYLID